jgi:hypothetical protein
MAGLLATLPIHCRGSGSGTRAIRNLKWYSSLGFKHKAGVVGAVGQVHTGCEIRLSLSMTAHWALTPS